MTKNVSNNIFTNRSKKNRDKYNDYGILYRIMKFLIFLFILVIIGLIVLFSTRLKNITIDGSNHYSEEEIQDLYITKETDKNALLFYLRHNYVEDRSIPFIEKIDISLIDRNSVHMQVYEKIVTGCIEYMDSYLYFDRDGIVVETSNKRIPNVPIVTGLGFSKLILHEPIEVDKPSVFQVILNLTQLIWTYDIDVNTIHFTNDLEVVLYIGKIRVMLGQRRNYDEQIAQLPNLLLSIEEEDNPEMKNKKLLIDMKNFEEGQDKIIAIPLE